MGVDGIYEFNGRKYRRVGECKQCGRCCVNIKTRFMLPEPDTRVHYFNHGYYVRPDGVCQIESHSRCRFLEFDGTKYWCTNYDSRPSICRRFPWEPTQVNDWCGYRFEELGEDEKAEGV